MAVNKNTLKYGKQNVKYTFLFKLDLKLMKVWFSFVFSHLFNFKMLLIKLSINK